MKTLEENKWDEKAHYFSNKRVQQKRAELTNLSMRYEQDTVILHPGRLARGFVMAGAAATLVSMWSVPGA